MRKILLLVIFLGIFLCIPVSVFAQQKSFPHDTYMTAQVIGFGGIKSSSKNAPAFKQITVRITSGSENRQKVTMQFDPTSIPGLQLKIGDTVVIAKTARVQEGGSMYYFVDQYRMTPVILTIIGFLILILIVAGWKGVGGVIGLFISLGVIFFFIVPQIIQGVDPLTVCVIGAVGILLLTTFIAHGFSLKTTIALFATLISLGITCLLAQGVSHFALLTGYGSEEATDLRFGLQVILDLRGIFLGGIILATLGALNDITVTQAATMYTLYKNTQHLSFQALFAHGFSIGREHAISLVNTLILAYAGTSLTLFIFLLANPNNQPLWVILNSEFFSEEIVKTIVGTAGLLLSVPLVTFLGAVVWDKKIREGVGDITYALFH